MTGPRPVAFPFGLAGECWSRKQGSDEAYETSALPLSYSAPRSSNSCMWLPLLDSNQARRVQSPVPCQLGEGATPYQPLSLAARRTLLLLGRAARIELAWSAWKVAALPLSYACAGGWCRSRTCPTRRSRRVSTALPCRSANHPQLEPSHARSTLRCGALVSAGGFEPPISCVRGRQGRPDSPTR